MKVPVLERLKPILSDDRASAGLHVINIDVNVVLIVDTIHYEITYLGS
jgi:hypothetical protein